MAVLTLDKYIDINSVCMARFSNNLHQVLVQVIFFLLTNKNDNGSVTTCKGNAADNA